MSSIKRSVLGVGASGFQQLANIALQLLSVPILLSLWGIEAYGTWIVISALPTYLSLTDFGFGTAASNSMAMRFARSDFVGASRTYFAALSLAVASSAAFGTVVISLVLMCPPEFLPNTSAVTADMTRITLVWLSIGTLTGMIRTVFYSVMYADGRYPQGIFILTSCRILEFLGLVGAVSFGASMATAACAVSTVSLATTIAFGIHIGKSSGWIAVFAPPRLNEIKQLAAPSFSFLLFPLATAINLQGAVLIVGMNSTAAAVVTLSTLRTLSRLSVMPLRSLMDAIRPELSRLYGQSQVTTLKSLVQTLSIISIFGALIIAIIIMILGPTIIDAWTHGKVDFLSLPFLFLLIGAAIQGASYPCYMLLYASNRHQKLAIAYLAINIIAALSCILVPHNRLEINTFILLLAEVAMAVAAVKLSARVLETSAIGFFQGFANSNTENLKSITAKLRARMGK